MAAPSSIAVAVDKSEYSRLETENNTITISILPNIHRTDLTSATIVGATTIDVRDATVFSTFPATLVIGSSGVTQETVTASSVSGNTITLSAGLTYAHPICAPVALDESLLGEVLDVSLVKARRNRDVTVATKQVSIPTAGPAVFTTTFFLPDIVDQNNAARTHRGSYFVQVRSSTDITVFGDSPDFLISIITVDRFKREWLHGVDVQALDTADVKNQPALISGVRVDFVSRGHEKGWFALSYNISDPGGCGTPVRLLSWCGGPVVTVRAGQTRYTLRKGKSPTDYIDVTVVSVDAMPVNSVAEELLVDREPIKDEFFQNLIAAAINWVEDTALSIYIEPTRVVTEIDPNQITYPAGSDIPTFVLADWDEQVDGVTYNAPAAGHWVNFKMPYYPIIQFYSLYGKASNVRILDIALEWISFNGVGGFVELVPFNQEVAYNFIGLIWVESIRGPIPIPNFWNFDALVGFKEVPANIVELIAKKAAIDALTFAGQAFRPGITGQSVSRDGVSESVSYLTSGMYGIFSGTIKKYDEWIQTNLPQLRGAYRGANIVVV